MSFDLRIKNGDFVLNNGEIETVVDNEKLVQDLLKICLTEVGSNPLHPWYGSYLSKSIIGNPNSTPMLMEIAKSQLNSAIQNLKELQDMQVRSFQSVSSNEHISAIRNISVYQNEIDPRLFGVSVTVFTKGFKQVNASFKVGI